MSRNCPECGGSVSMYDECIACGADASEATTDTRSGIGFQTLADDADMTNDDGELPWEDGASSGLEDLDFGNDFSDIDADISAKAIGEEFRRLVREERRRMAENVKDMLDSTESGGGFESVSAGDRKEVLRGMGIAFWPDPNTDPIPMSVVESACESENLTPDEATLALEWCWPVAEATGLTIPDVLADIVTVASVGQLTGKRAGAQLRGHYHPFPQSVPASHWLARRGPERDELSNELAEQLDGAS